MARITCKTPSTGKPLVISGQNVSSGGWVTIAEAPDFSVPDQGEVFPDRDPLDANRAIRPGEVFFLTPLTVANRSTDPKWIDVRLLTEAGATVFTPGRVTIPPGDTVQIPVQGRSLLKRVPAGTNGDRLQVQAESPAVLDLWCAAEERLSSEHIGVV